MEIRAKDKGSENTEEVHGGNSGCPERIMAILGLGRKKEEGPWLDPGWAQEPSRLHVLADGPLLVGMH